MKKLLIYLLMAALLFSQAIAASAKTFTDDENPSAAYTTAEEADKTSSDSSAADEKEENTDSDTTTALGSKTPAQAEVVPSESDLPEGYEIDPNFSMKITLNAENGWSYNLKDLLDEADNDEYIYFIVEEDVAEGYSDFYAKNGTNFSKSSPAVSTGNAIIVKNVKEGDPPIYELPESGGIGTAPFTVAGTAILLTAAVYGMILHRKRKKSA